MALRALWTRDAVPFMTEWVAPLTEAHAAVAVVFHTITLMLDFTYYFTVLKRTINGPVPKSLCALLNVLQLRTRLHHVLARHIGVSPVALPRPLGREGAGL